MPVRMHDLGARVERLPNHLRVRIQFDPEHHVVVESIDAVEELIEKGARLKLHALPYL